MPRPSHLDAAMERAAKEHVIRVPRPHLAQEYRDSNREPKEIDSICRGLLPHARMCAEGRARPHVVSRVKSRREKVLKGAAVFSTRAAWDMVDAGMV